MNMSRLFTNINVLDSLHTLFIAILLRSILAELINTIHTRSRMAYEKVKPSILHHQTIVVGDPSEDSPAHTKPVVNSNASKPPPPTHDQNQDMASANAGSPIRTAPQTDRPAPRKLGPSEAWTIEVLRDQQDGSVKIYQHGRLKRIEPPVALPQRALWFAREISMFRYQEERKKKRAETEKEEVKDNVKENVEVEEAEGDGKEHNRGVKRRREDNAEEVKEAVGKRRRR